MYSTIQLASCHHLSTCWQFQRLNFSWGFPHPSIFLFLESSTSFICSNGDSTPNIPFSHWRSIALVEGVLEALFSSPSFMHAKSTKFVGVSKNHFRCHSKGDMCAGLQGVVGTTLSLSTLFECPFELGGFFDFADYSPIVWICRFEIFFYFGYLYLSKMKSCFVWSGLRLCSFEICIEPNSNRYLYRPFGLLGQVSQGECVISSEPCIADDSIVSPTTCSKDVVNGEIDQYGISIRSSDTKFNPAFCSGNQIGKNARDVCSFFLGYEFYGNFWTDVNLCLPMDIVCSEWVFLILLCRASFFARSSNFEPTMTLVSPPTPRSKLTFSSSFKNCRSRWRILWLVFEGVSLCVMIKMRAGFDLAKDLLFTQISDIFVYDFIPLLICSGIILWFLNFIAS